MSNQAYPIKHQDEFNLSRVVLYICDTDAGKPTSGLNAGDLAWAIDTGILYGATASNQLIPVAFDLGNFWSYSQTVPTPFVIQTLAGSGFTSTLRVSGYTGNRNFYLPDYNGLGVVAGRPSNGDGVNALAQTASIASANLVASTLAGTYRITYYLRCTTADVTAGTIQANVTYTDSVGATTDSSAVVALTSTVNRAQGTIVADLASGNITYSTTLVGIAGTSQYKLRMRCEYLG